ncbi:MAG: alpha/beta fold hydrolase [Candidatus Tectomicrobia bacterium]|nr:alpha/beta fold hydrolase [Candidatus Tectomicrobia bacterium]
MPVAAVNGVNLYYEMYGDGFPIVLAHGYCASVEMWEHQISPLSQKYNVIAYDARGHGLSTAPTGKEHYTLTNLVDDLYALLHSLNISQAYIAGHSMGGATTIGFAARHPEMTRAALICNIDGGHQPGDPVTDKEAEESRKHNHQFVRERGLVDYARHQIATKMAPRFVLEDEAQQQAYIERYARQSLNGYFGVGEALPWRESWVKEAARSLKMPVVIIAGAEDTMYRGAELMHQHIPQSHYVLIENAPHDSMNARPDAFNKGFLEYLETLEQGKPVAGRRVL